MLKKEILCLIELMDLYICLTHSTTRASFFIRQRVLFLIRKASLCWSRGKSPYRPGITSISHGEQYLLDQPQDFPVPGPQESNSTGTERGNLGSFRTVDFHSPGRGGQGGLHPKTVTSNESVNRQNLAVLLTHAPQLPTPCLIRFSGQLISCGSTSLCPRWR